MITCKTCSKTFPKPVRRGRPPVQCDDCKGGKVQPAEKPAKAAETPVEAATPTKASSSPSVALKGGKKASAYTSGFCNRRHAPDIHRLCSTIGNCACACHAAKKAS